MARRNRLLTIVDQALSSLTNFMAGVFAAHILEPAEFGVYALIAACVALATGATRAMYTEVAMVRMARSSKGLGAVDSVALVAVLSTVASVCALTLIGMSPGLALAAGAGVGLMLVQDALRILAIGRGLPMQAVLNDALWLLSLAAIVLASIGRTGSWGVGGAVAAWGLSSAGGLVLGAFLARWLPRLSRGREFRVSGRRLGWSFLADWSLKSATGQLAIYGAGLAGGLTAVAGIRAALLALGPLNVLFQGLQLAAIPGAVALRAAAPERLSRQLGWLSVALGGSALLAGALLLVAPEQMLQTVVGKQVEGLREYVLPMAVYLASTGFAAGSHIGLRVLEAGASLVRTRILSTVVFLIPGICMLGVTGSARWGLWGFAIGGLLGVVLWHRAFVQTLRLHVAATPRLELDVDRRSQ